MKILIKVEEPIVFFENIGLPMPEDIIDDYNLIDITDIKLRDKIYSQLKKKFIVMPYSKEKKHTEIFYFIDMNKTIDFLMDIRHKYRSNLEVFTWIEKGALKVIFTGEGEEEAIVLEWLSKRYLKLKTDEVHEC